MSKFRDWLRGDYCVTPSGRSGKVLRAMPDGKFEIAYMGRSRDRVVIDGRLLRPWKPTPTRT